MTTTSLEVVVVGAGLAGLACALELQRHKVDVLVLEPEDRPGGRLRTDSRQGFLLDRGLHLLHEGLAETRRWLNLSSLEPRPLFPGVLCRWQGGFRLLSDPWKRPQALPNAIFFPLLNPMDKMRLASYRRQLLGRSSADLFAREEMTALDRLRLTGFSEAAIGRLFRPLSAGCCHEPDLRLISSRVFESALASWWSGKVSLPARGSESIPRDLAAGLNPDSVRYRCRIDSLGEGWVQTREGTRYECRALVVATEAREAARLLGQSVPPLNRGGLCFHYAAPTPPLREPLMVIDSEGRGPITSLICPSNLSSHYAPTDRALVQVHTLTQDLLPDKLELLLRQQLGEWFGSDVALWRCLGAQPVGDGLPSQIPPIGDPGRRQYRLSDRLWVCGEFLGDVSIEDQLGSGRRPAEGLLRVLRG